MEAIITLDVEDALAIAIKKAIAENKEGEELSAIIEDNFNDIYTGDDDYVLNELLDLLIDKGKVIYTDLEKGYQNIEGKVKVGKTEDGKEVYLQYQLSDSPYNDGIWSEYWDGYGDYLTYAVKMPKEEVVDTGKTLKGVAIPPAHTGKDFKRLQEHTFKYPESKTGEIKDRDLFVLDIIDGDSVMGISLHDCEDREAILNKAAELNFLISKNMKNFRRFKLDKIVD